MDNSSNLSLSISRARQDTAPLRRVLAILFRILFVLYTAFAIAWLLVGVLPALAATFPAFRRALADLANVLPALELFLTRVIRISVYGFFDPDEIFVRVTGLNAALQYPFSIINILLGIMLVRLRPRDLVAYLLAVGMIGTAAVFNWQSHSVMRVIPDLGVTIHDWFHILAGEAYVLAMILFPDGSLPGWRAVPEWGLVRKWLLRGAGLGLFGVALLMGLTLPTWTHGSFISFVTFFGFFIPLIGLSAQAIRYFEAATPQAREQSRILLWGLGAIFLLTFLLALLPMFLALVNLPSAPPRVIENAILALYPLLITTIPILLCAILLRYHLWNIDRVINRAWVYGALTAIVIAGYALIVGGLSELFHPRDDLWLSILATGLLALLFQPLRENLQRGINRLMYGKRDEPFSVLNQLGAQLENSLTPDAALPLIVETIGKNLRVPYAAIELTTDDPSFLRAGSRRTTEFGTPTNDVITLALRNQNETVGALKIARRAANENFSAADLQLLENLARQAGAVAYTARLHAQLQQSREKIIAERELERRRLRRDLHDGLGPTLASQTLKLDAALELLHGEDSANAGARRILRDVKTQTQNTVADIRRIVYELRPPALDDLGLLGALRAQLAQYNSNNRLHITFDVPDELPTLSAAVQVNAYRIVLEAVNNVVKHASAANCVVRIACDNDGQRTTDGNLLVMDVIDDGAGLPTELRAGVGVTSMRERAEELGGTFKIEPNKPKGTRIIATLPIENPKSKI